MLNDETYISTLLSICRENGIEPPSKEKIDAVMGNTEAGNREQVYEDWEDYIIEQVKFNNIY